MFIRRVITKNKKTEKEYFKHVLVESIRTEKGPRQRVIMQLGTLEIPKSKWKTLAACLERKLSGQITFASEDVEIEQSASKAMQNYNAFKQKKDEKEERKESSNFVTVDLNTISTIKSRSLGAELVVHNVWNQLNMNKILRDNRFTAKQQAIAEAVITSRLICPRSDLSTWKWLKDRTSLGELLNINIDNIGKDLIYEISDKLLLHKESIEESLKLNEQRLFENRETIYLYDLTNIYFEGQCENNELGKRGKSKEKRSDCPLVALALMVDSDGFPIFSQIYKGNQSEAETLLEILNRLEKDIPPLMNKPTLAMDRGIATKDNIKLIIDRGYSYIVIERRAAHKDYIDEFKTATETFTKIENKNNKDEVYIKKIQENDKCKILCLSKRKKLKEESMYHLKEKRFIEDLERLSRSVNKGNIKMIKKVSERIGRLKERYSSVAGYYDIDMGTDEKGKNVLDLTWSKKRIQEDKSILTGCYVIETNHKDMSAEKIWELYMTLTKVENAFHSLKSDLGLRPVHHQLAKRTEGHLFISVLAYHILISIEYQLKKQGDHRKWSTIKDILSTHQRTTVVLTDKDEKIYHVRVSGVPEKLQQEIYQKLEVKDPLKRQCSYVATRL